MEFHPASEIPPPLLPEDIAAMRASIRSIGLQRPILLYDGKIIDGRNRYTICKELGIEPVYEHYSGPLTPLEIVVANLSHRHMNAGQKAGVALNIEQYEATQAKERQRAAGGDRGNQYTKPKVAVPADLPEAADEPEPKRKPKSERKKNESREKAAAMTGASGRNVSKAKALEKEAPDLLEKVMTGTITINAADHEMKERKREQRRDENRQKIAVIQAPSEIVKDARFSTIVIDPPWDWGDEGDADQFGRARPDYSTMSLDKLMQLPVGNLADVDAHIYLWITNRSLPKGFRLLEAWGFRYITCLTWVKSLPDIVYKCQSCHNLFSSNDRGNEYGVQRHRNTEGVCKESLSQDQAGWRKPERESPEGLRMLQKGLCSDSQEHEILREGVCSETPIDGDGGEAPLARKPQPAQQGVDDINRLQIPVFAGTSNVEQAGVCGGTSTGYVGNPGASNSKRGACSSQKQGQDGQQARELGASQRSGSHGDALDSHICRVPMLRTCHCCGGTLKEYRSPGNFGMGNYFRGSTEQVLFGVKGSQPLKRKDAGTVFNAPRGPQGHSSKPVEFYGFVESCSPGPYLEIFSRTDRNDWTAWGESA